MTSTKDVSSSATVNGSVRTMLAPALLGVGALLLMISYSAAPWILSPANPAAETPAQTLDYSDLGTLFGTAGVPTTWEQSNYFAWIGWALLVLVVALGATTAMRRTSWASIATVVVGVAGLALTTFAFKGQMTWPQFWDMRENLRLGGYLAFAGFVLTVASGVLLRERHRA